MLFNKDISFSIELITILVCDLSKGKGVPDYRCMFWSFLCDGGHNGREGKGPGTSPSGWADAGSNPGSSNEGEKRLEHRKAPCT